MDKQSGKINQHIVIKSFIKPDQKQLFVLNNPKFPWNGSPHLVLNVGVILQQKSNTKQAIYI